MFLIIKKKSYKACSSERTEWEKHTSSREKLLNAQEMRHFKAINFPFIKVIHEKDMV